MKEENVLKIIQHYGVMPQLKYFQSEVFELNEAIFEYEKTIEGMYSDIDEDVPYYEQKYKKHITEEIADVMVMLEQFKLYYDISSEEITDVFWKKVNRQLDRIAKEEK